jgi:hypothetical protein
MAYPKRILSALAVVALMALPALRAANAPKPKVRAITGFITIDAKLYPSQIEETVKFLGKVRDGIRGAGFDVAGIRISTQPFPDYTRGLTRAEALRVLRGIDELAGKLDFAPNIGPAMIRDTDDTAAVDLLTDVLAAPGNRLNANIVTASADGIHWNSVAASRTHHQSDGRPQPAWAGQFQLRSNSDAQTVWTVLSGRVAPRWRRSHFCNWTRVGQRGNGRLRA